VNLSGHGPIAVIPSETVRHDLVRESSKRAKLWILEWNGPNDSTISKCEAHNFNSSFLWGTKGVLVLNV
jgi:hypothetical protein